MNTATTSDKISAPWRTASRQIPHCFNHRIADRINSRRKQQLYAVIEIGRDLLLVEEEIGARQFGEWLQAHCHIDEKAARRYMRFAKRFGDKLEVISELPDSILYKLGAGVTPEEVARVVLAYFEAGWPLPPNEIDRLIRERRAELHARYLDDIIG
ncbi:DUF3102 domain-containing protein [Skermanella mucosa]|uniref:DUF3102 domain-containing protein n=1 Tax=Skermanella mucosa TaxID=1789672 RepID=UPI00192A7750|nr:DUF3102 domain-containing protein [Skermanella mucosa]UEM18657.1 DUF3102 domain-containing protein [Skermanella mucosa]